MNHPLIVCANVGFALPFSLLFTTNFIVFVCILIVFERLFLLLSHVHQVMYGPIVRKLDITFGNIRVQKSDEVCIEVQSARHLTFEGHGTHYLDN